MSDLCAGGKFGSRPIYSGSTRQWQQRGGRSVKTRNAEEAAEAIARLRQSGARLGNQGSEVQILSGPALAALSAGRRIAGDNDSLALVIWGFRDSYLLCAPSSLVSRELNLCASQGVVCEVEVLAVTLK